MLAAVIQEPEHADETYRGFLQTAWTSPAASCVGTKTNPSIYSE